MNKENLDLEIKRLLNLKKEKETRKKKLEEIRRLRKELGEHSISDKINEFIDNLIGVNKR